MSDAAAAAYERRLILFLSVATFFEGYDIFALAQLLPTLEREMGFAELGAGALVAFTNLGTVVAFVLVRRADRFGRRGVLAMTIVGYALFSLITAAAPGAFSFAFAQFFARIFLIAEWAIAMVVAAEEVPAERRGLVIGVIEASSSLGAIACAALVPLLLRTPLGWRAVFLVSVVPLGLVAVARRGMRETGRFAAVRAEPRPLLEVLRGPYRRRILELAAIWTLTYLCTQSGVTFWKEFALHERQWTEGEVGRALSIAAVVAMPMLYATGPMLDRLGRRRGSVLVYGALVVGVFAAYTLRSRLGLQIGLILGVYGANAVLPVLNAYTSERFPTELRADGFAWANNLLGRLGYVIAPLAVGLVAQSVGWGPAVAATVAGPFVAACLILAWLPETAGQELETTSVL